MNPIQIQLNLTLDSDAIIDLLERAIEKGTTNVMERLLQQSAKLDGPIRDLNHIAQDSPQDQPNKSQLDAKLVDANAIAKMLGVSARMVWRLRDSGRIPRLVVVGRLVRWRLEAIDEWIQAGCPAVERRGVKKSGLR